MNATALSLIVLSCVIALGILLGKYKICGISLGVTWVLFVGIIFSHFGYQLDPKILHFMKEFGLILFVYSIGMQVGPSFFSSFRAGGIKLNGLAILVVLFGVLTTTVLIKVTHVEAPTLIGVMSGAVTNTPGLGAAQQAYVDATGNAAPEIALGYAVAYPLGVIGCIITYIILKFFYKRFEPKEKIEKEVEFVEDLTKIKEVLPEGTKFVHRKIVISKSKLHGVTLAKLDFDHHLGATVTRIRRAGIELQATPSTRLQVGDIVTVVGPEQSIAAVERILGNSVKKLDHPNLVMIFAGIALGCALGSIPIHFPGVPQPVKLGLAGGPLIVSILLSYFGPKLKIVTYTTTSANLMIREIGIALFLACVGLEAGTGFVDTIVNKGGYVWIGYGAMITIIPVFLCGLIGRYLMKIDYNTLLGVLAGSCTNPPALAFAGEQDKNSDKAAIGYATVYPLTMFLRVLAAQLMILFIAL